MRVLIIAPTNFQSYASSVLIELLNNPKVNVVGVIVHKITLKRFKQEIRRDGKRIFWKIINKAILRERNSLNFNFDTPKKRLNDQKIKANLKHICNENNLYFKEVEIFNSKKIVNEIKSLNLDVGAFCGGGILRDNFLKSFSVGVLNCHMGILPHYRGMDVVEWPFLENNNSEVGVTCHLMDKGIDTGDIIDIMKINYKDFKNFLEIREYLSFVMHEMMLKNIISIADDDYVRTSQLNDHGKQYFVMHDELKKIASNNLYR